MDDFTVRERTFTDTLGKKIVKLLVFFKASNNTCASCFDSLTLGQTDPSTQEYQAILLESFDCVVRGFIRGEKQKIEQLTVNIDT